MRSIFTPTTRLWRYVVIAIAAFSIGGGAVAQAVAPSGILGNVRIADRSDETRLAVIDSDGSLQVKVTSVATTQQVSGTVSVDNFPATQTVNVTGTVTTQPSVATRSLNKGIFLDPGKSGIETFDPINASFVQIISHGNSIILVMTGALGTVLGYGGGDDHEEYFFTQRVPINSITARCENLTIPCLIDVTIIGD